MVIYQYTCRFAGFYNTCVNSSNMLLKTCTLYGSGYASAACNKRLLFSYLNHTHDCVNNGKHVIREKFNATEDIAAVVHGSVLHDLCAMRNSLRLCGLNSFEISTFLIFALLNIFIIT